MFFLKAFNSIIIIAISAVILGIGVYIAIQTGLFSTYPFPLGLSDFEKIGFLLSKPNDLQSFYYSEDLRFEVKGQTTSNNATGSIQFYKRNSDYRLKLKLPSSFALGLEGIDLFFVNGNSTSCYSGSGKNICAATGSKDAMKNFFSKQNNLSVVDYFAKASQEKSSTGHVLSDYAVFTYSGSQNNFGRSCSKFDLVLTPLFYSENNLTNTNLNINFCLDDHIGFIHNVVISGESDSLFKNYASNSVTTNSVILVTLNLTDFRSSISDEDFKIPQVINK